MCTAMDAAPHKIRVDAVSLWVLWLVGLSLQWDGRIIKRMAAPEEIASAVLFFR